MKEGNSFICVQLYPTIPETTILEEILIQNSLIKKR